MKKVVLFFSVAVAVALSSCGGNKPVSPDPEPEAPQMEGVLIFDQEDSGEILIIEELENSSDEE
jgi:hypothetical protein